MASGHGNHMLRFLHVFLLLSLAMVAYLKGWHFPCNLLEEYIYKVLDHVPMNLSKRSTWCRRGARAELADVCERSLLVVSLLKFAGEAASVEHMQGAYSSPSGMDVAEECWRPPLICKGVLDLVQDRLTRQKKHIRCVAWLAEVFWTAIGAANRRVLRSPDADAGPDAMASGHGNHMLRFLHVFLLLSLAMVAYLKGWHFPCNLLEEYIYKVLDHVPMNLPKYLRHTQEKREIKGWLRDAYLA
ncbi:hypothetical protein ACQ4PT_018316 [Festuca glaucescens]